MWVGQNHLAIKHECVEERVIYPSCILQELMWVGSPSKNPVFTKHFVRSQS